VGDARGWPIQRVARTAGISEYLLRAYVRRGELPAFKGAKHVYISPADLVVVSEIDWQHVPAELEAAARHAHHERLVNVLALHATTHTATTKIACTSGYAPGRPVSLSVQSPGSAVDVWSSAPGPEREPGVGPDRATAPREVFRRPCPTTAPLPPISACLLTLGSLPVHAIE
jgi:hypothetical protein